MDNARKCVGFYPLTIFRSENLLPYIIGDKKSSHSVIKQEVEEKSLQIRISSLKKLDQPTNDEYKVPKIWHLNWVTPADSPREIHGSDIKNIKNNIKILSKYDKDWEMVLWTNDRKLIPKTASKLESMGIKVKDFASMANMDAKLQQKLDELIGEKSFCIVSEALRDLALKSYGGMYTDVDYIFYNSPGKLMKTFDFFAGVNAWSHEVLLETNIIGSKPQHEIMSEAVSVIKRNLFELDNAPDYVKYPCTLEFKAYSIGCVALTVAFYKNANQQGNADIVFDRGVLSNPGELKVEILSDYSASNIPVIGRDPYSRTWIQEDYKETIFYDEI